MKQERHYINRSNWLRAAVLGANDGILSTCSLAIAIAAAAADREQLVMASLAGMIAGAFSMGAGEYVSVSSQTDIEEADLNRERRELDEMPEQELKELSQSFESRGVDHETALKVAEQLSAHNALEAHAREELGIHDLTKANPFEAALASLTSFLLGAGLPFLVSVLFPMKNMVISQYVISILALMVLGAISAKTGGSKVGPAVWRITLWGSIAMAVSALVGFLFNANV